MAFVTSTIPQTCEAHKAGCDKLRALITEAEEIHMANGMLVEFCTNQLEGALTLQKDSRHKLQTLRKQLIEREKAEVSQ